MGEATRAAESLQEATFDVKSVAAMRRDGSEAFEVQSAFAEEQEVSGAELQMIKARTMFNMVEEIEGGTTGSSRKLLFLSNPQAEFLASSPGSLHKMLEALELPKPKLVINLLTSQGFRTYCSIREFSANDLRTEDACIRQGQPPFLDDDAELVAEELIDRFMADVLIPLAAQTNAIILCSATPQNCILAASLTRMYAVQRSKWSGRPPFTILSCSPNITLLYCNENPMATWREVRRASRAWRQRDRKLLELVHAQRADTDGKLPHRSHDLDPNAMLYILVDSIDQKKDRCNDKRAYNRLMTELVRCLGATLPSLAVKTGNANKVTLVQAQSAISSLGVAMEVAMSGTPLIFLDVRPRKVIQESTSRDDMISAAKQHFTEHCDALLAASLAESLDCCTIAYFHDVLNGDGNASSTELGHGSRLGRSEIKLETLHQAISRHQRDDESGASEAGDQQLTKRLLPASSGQIAAVASWLAERFFSDAWQLLPDREAREATGQTHKTYYKELIMSHATFMRTLLTSPNFHHVNLVDTDGANRLVSALVRLDRLPRSNPLEGLLLLRSAWQDFDISIYLSRRYKRGFKSLFFLQLLLTWAVVVISALGPRFDLNAPWSSSQNNVTCTVVIETVGPQVVSCPAGGDEPPLEPTQRTLLFALSVVISSLLSVDALFNAKSRWRQLRQGASSLESVIWCYRTRVGLFEMEEGNRDSKRPEAALCSTLNQWRVDLVANAKLTTSNLERKYAPSVYRHYQDCGVARPNGDDFQSPVQPRRYVALRLQGMIDFYQCRIPVYTRNSTALKLSILLLGIASSMMSYFQQVSVVAIVISATTVLTSWVEFSDMERKTERYTRAVRSLKALLSWWDSLTVVEKASKASIANLVRCTESIIADEQLSWVSTMAKQPNLDGKSNSTQEGVDVEENTDPPKTDSAKGSARIHPL